MTSVSIDKLTDEQPSSLLSWPQDALGAQYRMPCLAAISIFTTKVYVQQAVNGSVIESASRRSSEALSTESLDNQFCLASKSDQSEPV